MALVGLTSPRAPWSPYLRCSAVHGGALPYQALRPRETHPVSQTPAVQTPAYLTVQECAARVGVHPTTIRRQVWNGSISSIRVGRAVRIPASELDRLTSTASSA